MSDSNTQIKDLTEMERLVIGLSLNFLNNLLGNQINHIENHDPNLIELLRTDQVAQEDFILLQSYQRITKNLSDVFGRTFSNLSREELDSLSRPGIKLELFLHEIFNIIVGNENEE
jgi:hypothetical protein